MVPAMEANAPSAAGAAASKPRLCLGWMKAGDTICQHSTNAAAPRHTLSTLRRPWRAIFSSDWTPDKQKTPKAIKKLSQKATCKNHSRNQGRRSRTWRLLLHWRLLLFPKGGRSQTTNLQQPWVKSGGGVWKWWIQYPKTAMIAMFMGNWWRINEQIWKDNMRSDIQVLSHLDPFGPVGKTCASFEIHCWQEHPCLHCQDVRNPLDVSGPNLPERNS